MSAHYALIGIVSPDFAVMDKINWLWRGPSPATSHRRWPPCPLPALVTFLIAAIGSGAIAFLIYLANFRFIPLASPLATLMATVGMLILIDEIVVHATDGMPQPYPALFADIYIEWGDFGLRGDLVFIFVLSLIAMVVLMFMLYRTRLGIATRAVAQQPVAAQLAGISLDRTNALTFVITGMLGGLAGAMIGASVGVLSPLLVVPITVKGLIVCVIGGLGSIPGAIIAGLAVGAFENFFLAFRGVTERDMYVMLLLFVFLVFRPGGIFSRSVARD